MHWFHYFNFNNHVYAVQILHIWSTNVWTLTITLCIYIHVCIYMCVCVYLYTVSRHVLSRIRQKLIAHAQLESGALARYRSTVDHVTRFVGGFERHLADRLHTASWLTFPRTLLNLSLASAASETGRRQHESTASRTLELASLLELDEVQHVHRWKQRFWTRYHVYFSPTITQL